VAGMVNNPSSWVWGTILRKILTNITKCFSSPWPNLLRITKRTNDMIEFLILKVALSSSCLLGLLSPPYPLFEWGPLQRKQVFIKSRYEMLKLIMRFIFLLKGGQVFWTMFFWNTWLSQMNNYTKLVGTRDLRTLWHMTSLSLLLTILWTLYTIKQHNSKCLFLKKGAICKSKFK